MNKRGRPVKHPLKHPTIPRFVPPATTPPGYDAICGFCGAPFTFDNALAVGTPDYKNYCTQGCEEEATK